jgi:SAM-dependent methyltransferase
MGVEARVRGSIVRVRLGALRLIPARVRGPAVTRFLGWLAPPEMRRGSAYDSGWWDTFYAPVDPFAFDSNPREALKYDRTLELCGDGPFERALEIGCAEGAFTERLAARCHSLLAVDISDVAVRRASARTRDRAGVRCERMTLPAEFPDGTFDLVVASDVFYYWQLPDLEAALRRIQDAIAPGGKLVAAHYTPPMGAILDGNEVHDALSAGLDLPHVHSESVDLGQDPYRFDVFERAAGDR